VPYIGLIASRRRCAAVVAGLDRLDAARVHTPAGLDIGARTAPEVALSVLAEIMSDRPAAEGPAAERPDAAAPPEAALAAREATDPVCGMSVAIAEATPRHEHGGETWYFCGPGCRDAFAADPAAYT
jgi:xanthine dehydrogenase accessory factor